MSRLANILFQNNWIFSILILVPKPLFILILFTLFWQAWSCPKIKSSLSMLALDIASLIWMYMVCYWLGIEMVLVCNQAWVLFHTCKDHPCEARHASYHVYSINSKVRVKYELDFRLESNLSLKSNSLHCKCTGFIWYTVTSKSLWHQMR